MEIISDAEKLTLIDFYNDIVVRWNELETTTPSNGRLEVDGKVVSFGASARAGLVFKVDGTTYFFYPNSLPVFKAGRSFQRNTLKAGAVHRVERHVFN